MPDRLLRQSSHNGAVHAVRMTSDGSYCMTASDDRTVKLWNPHKSDPASIPTSASSAPSASSAMSIASQKQHASTGSSDAAVDSMLCVQTYSGVHGYAVYDIAIAADKTRFVSAGEDKACFLWDVMSNRVIRRIQAHNQRINNVVLNRDATVLFTASYDATVKIWDLRAPSRHDPMQVLDDFKDSVTSVHLAHESGKILASSVDGHVRVYDMRMGCMHADNIQDAITSVQVSDDEQSYVVACLTGKVRLIELETGQLLKEYQGHLHQSYKTEAVFNYNCGKVSTSTSTTSDTKSKQTSSSEIKHQIICGSEDGSLFHWDLLTGAVLDTSHKVHRKAISSLACHPSQDFFISASYDGSVKCWTSSLNHK